MMRYHCFRSSSVIHAFERCLLSTSIHAGLNSSVLLASFMIFQRKPCSSLYFLLRFILQSLLIDSPTHHIFSSIKLYQSQSFPIDFFIILSMIADNKEEQNIPEQHLFSLRPTLQQLRKPTVQCNFAPVECRKTFKILRTVPTYHPDLEQPFQTEAGLHTQSLKTISHRQESTSSILVAKPTHHFCQICKESFDDYLKHITHPLHQRRLKESEKSFSLDSLKEILDIKRKKGKKLTWFRNMDDGQCDKEDAAQSATSLSCAELKSQSSKKRIVLRQGEMEPISVATSTKCVEDDLSQELPRAKRRENRKFSNFRQMVEDS